MKKLLLTLFVLFVLPTNGWGQEITCPGITWMPGWNNCFGIYEYNNGTIYTGYWMNGVPTGQGTTEFSNGIVAIGEHKGGLLHGYGKQIHPDGRIYEGRWNMGSFHGAQKVAPIVTTKKPPKPKRESDSSGSGFFISKLGHIITNQHVVDKCQKITVGDNTKKQVAANVVETDRRNDLALLRISNMKMASEETKSLIQKLGVSIVPLASDGLMRSEDVELGEDVLVAGYPYGEVFSDTIKVTKGIVSATRGMGDDTGQFQIDAAVQPGNSGGPIYDENGNIVGVVISQLNKMKFAEHAGSIQRM